MIIKVCGITNIDDAKFALKAGADWIGLNLVGGPRQIDLAKLEHITSELDDVSPVVALVRLTGDQVERSLLDSLRGCGVKRLQLYGDASAATFEKLVSGGFESLVVQSVSDLGSLDHVDTLLADCSDHRPGYVILDAHAPDQLGGTGRTLNWKQLDKERSAGRFKDWPSVILAGGLTPDNVSEAIRMTRPTGVDVSSGVESSPGRKDQTKVEVFVRSARGG